MPRNCVLAARDGSEVISASFYREPQFFSICPPQQDEGNLPLRILPKKTLPLQFTQKILPHQHERRRLVDARLFSAALPPL